MRDKRLESSRQKGATMANAPMPMMERGSMEGPVSMANDFEQASLVACCVSSHEIDAVSAVMAARCAR